MKRLEVIVSKGESKKVREILDQCEFLYTSGTIKIGDETCVVYSAILPDQFIDSVIDMISKQIDLRLKQNMISVYNVEATVSTYIDRLKEKVAKIRPLPNPLERLVASTERYTRLTSDILTMACFATLVVLAGLFLDNVAIVIGAMLLSPLLGPISAFAVNAVLGRVEKLIKSQFSIVMLLVSVGLLSAFITYVTSFFIQLPLTSQITIRTTVSLTDIGIAVILGFAGGLALVIAIPEILVGVAVAVALLPPAAVTGIGLALMDMGIFFGAMLLTFVNLLGLQLGSVSILWMKGVTPRRYHQKAVARKHTTYSLLTLSILLLILSIIIMLIEL
ncbi:MAG: TIGR00341 family protein [Candidatus Methylarchaceae archaeon HK02M1]|nr:TIGR00341 family protein [Candidatus Methylarchaceae archaeon HK01M]MCP8311439.1 TIGR00341 family protein [Candidatus Methylarchaceae archaeon HK02M1]